MPLLSAALPYRQSRFKGADRDRFIVTSVTYRLDDSGQPQIRYPELRRHVNDAHPTLATVRDAVLALRRRKSMVIDPQESQLPLRRLLLLESSH